MSIKECYDKLNGYTDKELTAKELTELGISRYFIDKLLENGKLERSKRGVYNVKSLKKKYYSRANFYIREFCQYIMTEEYSPAYTRLQKACESKTDDRSDTLLRVAFTLMPEIIEYRNPVVYLDSLKPLVLDKRPNSEYWNKFCLAALDHNYEEALKNIQAYADFNKERLGQVGDVTLAMISILTKILSLREDRKYFNDFIDQVKSLIDASKYEEAINYINGSIEKIQDKQIKEKYNSLLDLIKTIKDLKDGKKYIIDRNSMAKYGHNHPKILLNYYLRDKNYPMALEQIEEACKVDGRNYNILVRDLLLEFKKLHYSKIKKPIIRRISVPDSRYHFKRFLKIFSLDNLKESARELEESIAYLPTDDENYNYNTSFLHLIEKVIRMQEEGETLDELNINYNIKSGAINNFNKAIENKDYKKAIAFKNLISNIGSDILRMKLELLNAMVKLDKVNREKQKNEAKETEEVKEVIEEKLEKEETPTIKSKEENTIPFSYEALYDYIYNRDYDNAFILNSSLANDEYGRLRSVSNRLIKVYKELESGLTSEPREFTLNDDLIKDFYLSLNNHNYTLALDLVNDILDYKENIDEFRIYKLILEDIVDLYNKNIRLKEIKEEINSLSNKALVAEDVHRLIELIEEYDEMSEFINIPNNYNNKLMDMANMTLLGITRGFTNLDFSPTEIEKGTTMEGLFTSALNTGDYLTVHRIINTSSWDEEILKKYPKTFLKLTKRLTNLMFANLHIVKEYTEDVNVKVTEAMEKEIERLAYELMNDEEKRDKYTADVLAKMRSLIKKRHYEEAFELFLSSDISYKDPEVIGSLLMIRQVLYLESEDLYNKYLKGLEENNPDTARYLMDYKDYIARNFMENTQSFKEKNLKI